MSVNTRYHPERSHEIPLGRDRRRIDGTGHLTLAKSPCNLSQKRGKAHMRVHKPLPGFMVEDRSWQEEDDKGQTDQNDRIVKIHGFPGSSDSRKVKPNEDSEEGKEEARKFGKLSPVQAVPG